MSGFFEEYAVHREDDDNDEYDDEDDDDEDDGFVVYSEEAQDAWENEESHARLHAKYVREEDEATREAVAQEARRVEERFAREKRRAHEVATARAQPPQRGAKKPKVFLRIGGGRVKKNLLYKKPPPQSSLAPIFQRKKKAAAGGAAAPAAAAPPLSKVHTCAVKTCRNPVAPHSLHCANHCKRKRKFMNEAQQAALRKNIAASARRVAKLREKSKLFVEQFTLREIVRARNPPTGGLGCVFCDAPRRKKHVMTCKEHGRLAQLRTLLGSMSEADVKKKIRAEDTRIASMRTALANVRTVRRLTRVEEYRNRVRAAAREKFVWKECAECAHRWRPPRQGGGGDSLVCPECGASVVPRMVAFHR